MRAVGLRHPWTLLSNHREVTGFLDRHRISDESGISLADGKARLAGHGQSRRGECRDNGPSLFIHQLELRAEFFNSLRALYSATKNVNSPAAVVIPRPPLHNGRGHDRG
ncbi:hypothetical protein EVAR_69600_1 [Eumeta japonica]|uniref:Uncharacterized protein n=1 Tax=Eumeta variegata TaxID=151549 RepID=A0A4C1ZYV1_EUMVA|nr:hypothetical protein EVAR_69600_1 [Eumeta japonica]